MQLSAIKTNAKLSKLYAIAALKENTRYYFFFRDSFHIVQMLVTHIINTEFNVNIYFCLVFLQSTVCKAGHWSMKWLKDQSLSVVWTPFVSQTTVFFNISTV